MPLKLKGEYDIILPPSLILIFAPAFKSTVNPFAKTKGEEITIFYNDEFEVFINNLIK